MPKTQRIIIGGIWTLVNVAVLSIIGMYIYPVQGPIILAAVFFVDFGLYMVYASATLAEPYDLAEEINRLMEKLDELDNAVSSIYSLLDKIDDKGGL